MATGCGFVCALGACCRATAAADRGSPDAKYHAATEAAAAAGADAAGCRATAADVLSQSAAPCFIARMRASSTGLHAIVCARTDVENQALLSPTKRHILDSLCSERANSILEAMDHQ